MPADAEELAEQLDVQVMQLERITRLLTDLRRIAFVLVVLLALTPIVIVTTN